ncbi:MAG: hypothetical protein HGA76_12155 [Candidatus Firestonebacteria bacterium]|nr:hypothetical protein [Candidatus Firestonebacteria bacterium]
MTVKSARAKSVFVCQDCGTESPKWVGQCPGCSAWNRMVEETRRAQPPAAIRAAAPSEPVRLRDVDNTLSNARGSVEAFAQLHDRRAGGVALVLR